MSECYLTFPTMTAGQRGARILERNGVPARLVRTPQAIAQRGCGASLLVAQSYLTEAMEYLRLGQAPMRGAYCRMESGGFRAVIR